ncbi:MAG TPA: ABC transporter ATP-binding protein [Clostridia bacterium]
MENIAVEVRNLTKKYGRNTALQDLSFDIGKGEIFGLFGPNGAGKSTFLSILATILKPTSGDIRVNGYSVREQPGKVKGEIGYVPQDIALYPMLSGRENLDFWAGIYGLRGKLKKERIEEAIEVVRLGDRIRDRVSRYSGGMKRRLNIAVSLMHHPRVLLMDEPTVGVDIQSRGFILDALSALKKEGRTIIFTSHYIDELETLCDRIAIMDKGKILAMGPADELKKANGADDLETVLLRLTNVNAG